MRWGSATEHARTMAAIRPRSRRRCGCGCRRRATHTGLANGVALTSGCELSVRRWVKDPLASYAAEARLDALEATQERDE
jgi:hypothetical protein